MAKKITEAQIIDGLKNNDSRVCRYLFEEHYTPLLYFAESIIQNHEEAQDIVTEVFTRFWDMRNNFESEGSIKAFLYTATRNKCFDYLRYRQRQMDYKKEYSESRYLSGSEKYAETESLVVKAELLYKIYREAQKLPEKCRKIFFLTYFEGMRADEIAKLLHVSVTNVTSQRARAIRLLKLALLRNGELPVLIFLLATTASKTLV